MNSDCAPLPTIDVARYRSADPDLLVEHHRTMAAALAKAAPGFVSAQLARLEDGTWLDLVTWESRAAAEAGIAAEPSIPEFVEFVQHVGDIVWSATAEVVSARVAELTGHREPLR